MGLDERLERLRACTRAWDSLQRWPGERAIVDFAADVVVRGVEGHKEGYSCERAGRKREDPRPRRERGEGDDPCYGALSGPK